MRAILIDPDTETISEVDYNGDYRQIHKLIEASCFDLARIDACNSIYVDDEGMLVGKKIFAYEGYPLAGKGLVLGVDDEGNSISPSLTLDQVKQAVRWHGFDQGVVF